MRLLILSLLAVAAHGHSISYRNNLQAFAPARGEFPVRSELAQGYLRYLDNTGAERLVGFNYPEPLYGIRSEIYTPEQLRVASNKLEAQQQHLALFRAWCEQRYNALRVELERLRAEGKQPSANILSQFEPLEQLIKTNAFEPVPGLSPEVQRARDEHLRIWNESRLQVLQAELAQGGQLQSIDQRFTPESVLLKTTPVQPIAKQPQATQAAKLSPEPLPIKPATSNQAAQQPYVPLESPKPVQETAEVLRAREEHLKLFNAALQAQQAQPAQAITLKKSSYIQAQPQQTPQIAQIAPQAPQILQTPKLAPLPVPQIPQLAPLPVPQTPQQAPMPVEETPEVKRAREEHLQQVNEIRRQQQELKKLQPLDPLSTATTSSEYKKPEAIAPLPAVTIKNSIPQAQPAAAPIPIKNIHEQKIQLLTQIKLKAEDKVADYEDRIRFEEREREAELFREKELRREEQKQAELEREREELRLIEEQQQLAAERQALQMQEQQRLESERQQEAKRLQAEQQFIFAVDSTPSQPISSYKVIAPTPVKPQTQPQAAQPLIQPQAIAQQQQVQNGFFLRIQAGGQQGAEAIPETIAQNPFLIRYIQQPEQAQVKVLSSSTGSSSSSAASASLSSSSTSSTSITTGLSELEKATREHFKAHEIALEQLRLANLKNPEASPIPCQHN
ncbi:bromodomain-containing protein DDB_G0280777 [Drosophila nasuta]|uniref:bromodomain-containing protein DDB_G0280777 n=1 Tax=Drosophila nasuta TaxID=42062 RepID=UPI00295EB0B5|nr:bromodomain-containing protein DDB_G0280777 [Drosophila nasuta]